MRDQLTYFDSDGIERCGFCNEVAETTTVAPHDTFYNNRGALVVASRIVTVHPCEHARIEAP
jgi:hypothetical protein